jgi:N-acyl-D-aspartate/D-glutamate deacylase
VSVAAEPPPVAPFRSEGRVDLVIEGGEVVDGTGRPRFAADVVVDAGRIVHVGPVDASVQAGRRIDARGMVVTPGFIDAHSHGQALAAHENFIAMGVTTLCIGQDGFSPDGKIFARWAEKLRERKLVLNVAGWSGHATLRQASGIAPETPRGLAAMVEAARADLAAGAFGVSFGLEYLPKDAAPLEELVALGRAVAEHGGVVMSHLRSEDDDKIDAALDDLVAVGERSGARVHVAHLKVVLGKGVERAERLLGRMDEARKRRVSLTADIYPYAASYTDIGIVFPDWAKHGDRGHARASRRAELAAHLRERVGRRGGPAATLFGTGRWRGRTLKQVASELGKPFEDVLIDDIGPRGASAAYFVMDEELQDRLLVDPHVMISTDGQAGSAHPRAYGAFARVLRSFVGERRVLTLEEAVRKMSGLTADAIGLADRGLVRVGLAADLCVFAPGRVTDRATYLAPSVLAEGIDWVLVNGQAVRKDGRFTRARPGRLLLHARPPRGG